MAITLEIEPLSESRFAPYGWVLGKPTMPGSDGPFYASSTLTMWRTHLFDTGGSDKTDVLWMSLTCDDSDVERLQARWITEEALIPLSGPVVQIVASSTDDRRPDMDTLRAFEVPVGLGVCVRPQCWYSTRALNGDVTSLVLSRRSSTYDFLVHLQTGAPACETGVRAIEPRSLVALQSVSAD